jgi:S-adenosylmethionine:tRNA-ribosyltransferase-isomerase (queuine synthetase)
MTIQLRQKRLSKLRIDKTAFVLAPFHIKTAENASQINRFQTVFAKRESVI